MGLADATEKSEAREKGQESMRVIHLECDEDDYGAIQRAIARRQLRRSLPDGDGNQAGRVIAEICRAWEELLDELREVE